MAAAKEKDSEAAAGPAAAVDDEAPRPQGAAMDTLLTDSGPGGVGRFIPGKPIAKALARLAARPDRVVRRVGKTAAESAKVWAGRSELEPPKGDRRFKDDAWRGNPAFRRLSQLYLLWGREVDGLIDDADLDWQDERRLRFAADNVVGALAPTNFPAANPAVLKATLDNRLVKQLLDVLRTNDKTSQLAFLKDRIIKIDHLAPLPQIRCRSNVNQIHIAQ